MANELGWRRWSSNDGEIYSAFGNARQNGLTPSVSTARRSSQPGQVVYHRAISIPARPTRRALRRSSATTRPMTATYEPGVATFAKTRGDLTLEYVVFVPPGSPVRHAAI